jgi:hypothetical protein
MPFCAMHVSRWHLAEVSGLANCQLCAHERSLAFEVGTVAYL